MQILNLIFIAIPHWFCVSWSSSFVRHWRWRHQITADRPFNDLRTKSFTPFPHVTLAYIYNFFSIPAVVCTFVSLSRDWAGGRRASLVFASWSFTWIAGIATAIHSWSRPREFGCCLLANPCGKLQSLPNKATYEISCVYLANVKILTRLFWLRSSPPIW